MKVLSGQSFVAFYPLAKGVRGCHYLPLPEASQRMQAIPDVGTQCGKTCIGSTALRGPL